MRRTGDHDEPRHRSYYEPFCGGLAVLMGKPHCSNEMVGDLHGELCNLASVLAGDRWRDLYEAVDRLLLCQEWIDQQRDGIDVDFDGEPDVRRAAVYMALAWMCRNGVAGTERLDYSMAIRWSQNGGAPGVRWRSAVDSVPAWHDRLKGVCIARMNGFDMLRSIEDQRGTVVYCDPPYLRRTRGGQAYHHEFGDAGGSVDLFGAPRIDDHDRLANELRRFERARVLVSYYADARLPELYPSGRWTHIDCATRKNLANANGRGHRGSGSDAPEVLIVNGEAY
jgi:DNA adenine methylase